MSSATLLSPALLSVWMVLPVLLLRARAPLDGHGRGEVGREQPRPPVPAHPEAAPGVRPVEVAPAARAFVAAACAVHAGREAGSRGSGQQGRRNLAVLLDELPCDDPEDLLDALARLGADLVAGVPANFLAPEPGRPLRGGTTGLGGCAVAAGKEAAAAAETPGAGRAEVSRGSGRRGRGAEARGEILGDVSLYHPESAIRTARERALAKNGAAESCLPITCPATYDYDLLVIYARKPGSPGTGRITALRQ